MTARELYNAYMRGHKMVQLEGKENHDLLMLPVLLGCVCDIYYKHLRKTARTSTQTKLGKGIREIMTSLIGREYWGMSADEIDSFCTYMDAMTSELQYQIFGLQRAMYNYYEDYEDNRRKIMSWSMTAHSIAYTMARLREKMFVAVNKEDVEFDRQRQQSKYDRLDALFTEYARTYDNRPDEIRSPQAVDAIGDASREFVHRVMKLVAGDLDKEIINEDDK